MVVDVSKVEEGLDAFEARFGVFPKAVSRLIRPALIAPEGKTLVWGDWASIEARVLPWLTKSVGGQEVLDIFEGVDADPSNPDIYMIEAGKIYGKPASDVAKAERQVGKVLTLALGFGGGPGALHAMAAGYGMSFEEDEAIKLVGMWREGNAWAVNFWRDVTTATTEARRAPGEGFSVGRLSYFYDRSYLGGSMFCALPCGRILTYSNMRVEKVSYEHEITGEKITEEKLRYQKGYKRSSAYFSIYVENGTQGAAASMLRATLRHIERDETAPVAIVGHTHDEIITECDEDNVPAARAYLHQKMLTVPEWGKGLPIAADISDNWFYTKNVE